MRLDERTRAVGCGFEFKVLTSDVHSRLLFVKKARAFSLGPSCAYGTSSARDGLYL